MWRLLFLGVVPAASDGLTSGLDGVLHTHSDHALYAVNKDGSTKWVFDSKALLYAHAEGLNNTVYACTENTLFSLHGGDGSILWNHQVPGDIDFGMRPYVAKDGTVYLTSSTKDPDSMLLCENTTIDAIASTGEVKWTFTRAGCGRLSDVGPDGTLFMRFVPDTVISEMEPDSWFAIQPDTGAAKWSVALTDEWRGLELSISGPHVFLVQEGGSQSVVSSLSYEDGSTRWSYHFSNCNYTSGHALPAPVPAHVTIGNGHRNELYVSGIPLDQGMCSYGVFDFNGKRLRNLPCAYDNSETETETLPCLPQSVAYSPVEYPDAFVSDSDGNVLAFSGLDGGIMWKVPLEVRRPPYFYFGDGGFTFVIQEDEMSADAHGSSHVSALRTGEIRWRVQTRGTSEPLMLDDGATYVDGWHRQEDYPMHADELELVAVGADGVEKWRFRPTKGPVEEMAEAIEIAV